MIYSIGLTSGDTLKEETKNEEENLNRIATRKLESACIIKLTFDLGPIEYSNGFKPEFLSEVNTSSGWTANNETIQINGGLEYQFKVKDGITSFKDFLYCKSSSDRKLSNSLFSIDLSECDISMITSFEKAFRSCTCVQHFIT